MHVRCLVLIPKEKMSELKELPWLAELAKEAFEENTIYGVDWDYWDFGGRWSGLFDGKDYTELTEKIYNEYLKEYEGLAGVIEDVMRIDSARMVEGVIVRKRRLGNPIVIVDSGEEISKKMVGRYWVVVIDYHV